MKYLFVLLTLLIYQSVIFLNINLLAGTGRSKSKNSPFINWRFKGAATDVIVCGEVVMKDRKLE